MMKRLNLSFLVGALGLALGIVSLVTVWTPQPGRAQFSDQMIFVPASGVGGSGNGVTLNIPNITQFSDILGVPIRFLPQNNNGLGTTSVNPSSLGAKNVMRIVNGGIYFTTNNDFAIGALAEIIYDGTQFIQTNPATGTVPIGTAIDSVATTCPLGFQEATGAALLQSNYNPLSTVTGGTWGSSAGNVVLPDLRGRATFSRDSGGSARITVAGGNFDGTMVANTGGLQNHLLQISETPAHSHSISDPGHTHTFPYQGLTTALGGGAPNTMVDSGAEAATKTTAANTTGITGTTNTGGGGAHTILNPAAIVIKCVKT